MKYVRVTLLSMKVKHDTFYMHLGETRGRMRQLLLEIDTTAGMWMERHIRRGSTSRKFPNGVWRVQLKNDESKELHGRIYYATPNPGEPKIMNVGHAILAAFNNSCPILMKDDLVEVLRLKAQELQLVFPEYTNQIESPYLLAGDTWENIKSKKVLIVTRELELLAGEERTKYLQKMPKKTLLILMDFYVSNEQYETAAEVKNMINSTIQI